MLVLSLNAIFKSYMVILIRFVHLTIKHVVLNDLVVFISRVIYCI